MELGTPLRTWLELPPGPWPPDHYALLALPPGASDLAEIEARVLDRMDRLRPHQLIHPEVVTEGMNRLAQALVCLTDPVAKAAYDRELGFAPAPFEVVDEVLEDEHEAALAPRARQQNLPYEVPEPEPRSAGVLPYEVVPEDTGASPLAPAEPNRLPRAKLKRRTIYKRLAALRRAIPAWEALRPVMGTPDEALSTPIAVLVFLRALAGARAALPGAEFALAEPPGAGGTVLALVRQPAALPIVRGLLPSQRRTVARDWSSGYALLLREREYLRALTFRTHVGRRAGARFRHAIRQTPELLLAVLAVLVLLRAALRRRH